MTLRFAQPFSKQYLKSPFFSPLRPGLKPKGRGEEERGEREERKRPKEEKNAG